MDKTEAYSNDTFRMLRNVRLLDEGEFEGKRFVRCIPARNSGRDLSADERRAIVQRAVREINEPGVVLSNNPNYGGDYLRVEINSKTYWFICRLLS